MSGQGAILAAVLLLAGCSVTTPDGVHLAKGANESEVRARLGEPDWEENFGAVPGGALCLFGHPPGTTLYYVDRGYCAVLYDWGLSHVYRFTPAEQGDEARMAKAYNASAPLAAPGTPLAEVMERLGNPAVVEESWTEHGFHYGRYLTPDELMARSPLPESFTCYFPVRDVLVVFEHGRVERVAPIRKVLWEQVFHREPPALGPQKKEEA